jgi:DNA-binding protein H-NS
MNSWNCSGNAKHWNEQDCLPRRPTHSPSNLLPKRRPATTAARKEEKDEIAEIQQKIAENKKLQAEYAAQGLETNDLVSQELSLYRQLAAAQSRPGHG